MTSSSSLQIQGTTVHIDGDGPHTVVMLHGWPDTHRLWDDTVARLSPHWRCVRFTLPGFDIAGPREAASLDRIVALLQAVCETCSPGQPVTLLLHDWGCLFGYQFALRHPQRVHRLIGVDVGDAGSPQHLASLTLRAKLGIAAYQLWLAAAWRIGGALGDRMARAMARWLRCPTPSAGIHAGMGYPYDMTWTGSHGGLRRLLPLNPGCPMLFLYGRRKPFHFHSKAWAEALAARPGCAVVPVASSHWVMVDQPALFADTVRDWLQTSA